MADIEVNCPSVNCIYFIYQDNASYATAHDAATGIIANVTYLAIGQLTFFGGYQIYRTPIFFDTSEIPAAASISSAILYFHKAIDGSATDFDITIQNGQPTYPHDPIVTADYNKTNCSGDGGTLNTANFVNGWNHIDLNADGISWIQKEGATKFYIKSSRDISNATPTGNEYVTIQTSASTGYEPYLLITYPAIGGVDVDIEVPLCTISDITPLTPIVVTPSASDFQSMPRFHVKQLIYDHDLNTYLKTNMEYLKSLENIGLFPIYSDYIPFTSLDGFTLGSNPGYITINGLNLGLIGHGTSGKYIVNYPDTSTKAVAADVSLVSKGYLYKVQTAKYLTFEIGLSYISATTTGKLTFILSTSDDTTANKIGWVIQGGVIKNARNEGLSNLSSECFASLKVICNPGSWNKYFVNNKFVSTDWSPVATDSVLRLYARCDADMNMSPWFWDEDSQCDNTYITYTDAIFRVLRILITQEY